MTKPKEEITPEELADSLEKMAAAWGSQKNLAKHLGIGNGYLSDIINRVRPASNKVAKKLGYLRVVRYTREGDLK